MSDASSSTEGTARAEHLIVIMTVHNRREHTVACLRSLSRQRLPKACSLSVVLVDDGSTDGSTDAAGRFPFVTVVRGDGDLFWAGGMALAQHIAERRQPDHLLWLNDDVVLYDGALDVLLMTARTQPAPSIIVGATRSGTSGRMTYSGIRRVGRNPTRLRALLPSGEAQAVDTFHGNVVLVPREIYRILGGIDPAFGHGYGDNDYGLRALQQEFACVLATGYAGTCEGPAGDGGFHDATAPRRKRMRALLSAKAMPLVPQALYTRRHGGCLWPIYLVRSYVAAVVFIALRRPC